MEVTRTDCGVPLKKPA